jgi:protein O-GlcNAcase / histone acetyltransferase
LSINGHFIPDSISDIKLETENDDDDENLPNYLTENIYHPRVALKNAILEWLPDFFQEKQAFGPIVKPHPASALAPIIPPIIPSVNTCMTLTLTTPTTSSSVSSMMIPEVNTSQLHALADICSSVTGATELMPKPSVMNSLVSATKVVTTDVLTNPILVTSVLPDKMPVSSVPIPMPIPVNIMEVMDVEKTPTEAIPDENETLELMDCGTPKHTSDSSSLNSDVQLSSETQKDEVIKNGSPIIQMEPEIKNEKSQLSDDVVMTETMSNHSMQIEIASDDDKTENHIITYDDILLFCDMFYLPFEHGKQGLQLLNEFQWLKINANVLSGKKDAADSECPEVQEWFRRSDKLLKLGESVFLLTRRIASCVNQELCYDLFTYAWEISSVVSIYMAYVKWLALGQFPANSNSYTQGSYTWFSKGWKETFMSGDQEPWVFRGGLIADLQRLIPVDSGNDLFIYTLPERPTLNFYSIRPYCSQDETEIFSICHKTCRDGSDCTELFPESLQEIPADRLIAPFVTLNPEFCMVVENSNKTLVGYACAALDAKLFYRSQEVRSSTKI